MWSMTYVEYNRNSGPSSASHPSASGIHLNPQMCWMIPQPITFSSLTCSLGGRVTEASKIASLIATVGEVGRRLSCAVNKYGWVMRLGQLRRARRSYRKLILLRCSFSTILLNVAIFMMAEDGVGRLSAVTGHQIMSCSLGRVVVDIVCHCVMFSGITPIGIFLLQKMVIPNPLAIWL